MAWTGAGRGCDPELVLWGINSFWALNCDCPLHFTFDFFFFQYLGLFWGSGHSTGVNFFLLHGIDIYGWELGILGMTITRGTTSVHYCEGGGPDCLLGNIGGLEFTGTTTLGFFTFFTISSSGNKVT